MPRYDFTCAECGFKFEKSVPSDIKRVECPYCNDTVAVRQWSAPTFRIIGGTPKFYGGK